MNRLDGKVAVIVGAAGRDNMGQTIARRFREEGAQVFLAGRREAELREAAAGLQGHYGLCDVTRKADLDSVAQAAIDAFGRVDVAVNCTGWAPMIKLLETTEEQIDRLTALQFKGTYFFLQVFVGLMASTGGGSVIQLSSASVHALLFNHAAYIGTKAGGEALVRCFANEFGAKGVKVNTLAPGLTASPMTENEINLPGLQQAFLKEYPLGRIGTAADVADAALWLAGDESFVTGQTLQVNGGLTLRRNPTPKEISASMRSASTAPRT